MNNKKQKVFEMINMTKMAADGFMRKKKKSLTLQYNSPHKLRNQISLW